MPPVNRLPTDGPDPAREYEPFAPRFPSLPIVTPDPPRKTTAEKYGALFYLGAGGLLVLLALVGWFGWSAWTLRTVWRDVYVLHDQARPEAERVAAAYALAHDPNVNQRQLWDIALRKPLPPLARYVVAEALTPEAAAADPRGYGVAVLKSEGWPDWLRLLLLRPMTYAAAQGRTVDRPSLRELAKNPDRTIALWAQAALAFGPAPDAEAAAALRQAAATAGPVRGTAERLATALDATRGPDRIAALDDATVWLRGSYPPAAELWSGWKVEAGRLLPGGR